jgi:hypothetical protein
MVITVTKKIPIWKQVSTVDGSINAPAAAVVRAAMAVGPPIWETAQVTATSLSSVSRHKVVLNSIMEAKVNSQTNGY